MTSITLKKISEVLGLSISTISRALKNHPDISDKTKQRVIELANTLEYEPNVNAIHLRTKKNNVFGLIVPSISNYFYDSFIASVEEETRKNNFSLMILQSGDNADVELTNIKLCRQNRITGLFASLASDTNNFDAYTKLKDQDIPVVFFDKVPEAGNCNKVCVADELASKMAAQRLLVENKKTILAIFGNPQMLMTRKRMAAFKEACMEQPAGFTLMIEHANSTEAAEFIVEQYLGKLPDAIFCMSDEILIGAMKTIQKYKIKIPAEVGMICLSNGLVPKLYYPEITYVETSGYKLGKLAFSSMMSCIDGSTFIQEMTTDAILVEGGSL